MCRCAGTLFAVEAAAFAPVERSQYASTAELVCDLWHWAERRQVRIVTKELKHTNIIIEL